MADAGLVLVGMVAGYMLGWISQRRFILGGLVDLAKKDPELRRWIKRAAHTNRSTAVEQ